MTGPQTFEKLGGLLYTKEGTIMEFQNPDIIMVAVHITCV